MTAYQRDVLRSFKEIRDRATHHYETNTEHMHTETHIADGEVARAHWDSRRPMLHLSVERSGESRNAHISTFKIGGRYE